MTDTETSTTAGSDRGRRRPPTDLGGLAAAFARARRADIPTYAPRAFDEAMAAWRSAVAAPDAERDASIERAVAALSEAEARASRSADLLADVSRRRVGAMYSERDRFHAPDVLGEAERHYRDAVLRAERGDAVAAQAEADAARKAFDEAALLGLERGPIATLETAIRELEDTAPPEALRASRAEVDELRRAVDETRRGDQGVVQLRRRISVGSGRIGAHLGDVLAPPTFDPPVGDPTWAGPPDRVKTIRVTARASDSLTVTWKNPTTSASRNVLLRQREAGPWDQVAEFDDLTGWTTHVDDGLDDDTLYCYRVRSENDQGIVTTGLDDRAGGYTRAVDPVGVWRVQLRVRTADVANAGTTDPVEARLTSPLRTFSPNGNRRWLDYGPRWEGAGPFGWRDDFGRDREFTYDLDQGAIGQLSDISMLTLAKEGTDAVGIAELGLLVNGTEVFSRVFGETAASCLWIDDGDGHQPQHTIWHGELRADPKWQAFETANHQPPFRIPNDDVVSRVESLVGHAIHGSAAHWGEYHSPAWVEATFLDAERLHVDIDLEADVPVLADPEIDIDFTLRFAMSCNQADETATLSITAEDLHANVDFDVLTEVLGTVVSFGQFWRLEDWIADQVERSLQPIVPSFTFGTGGFCPTVAVDADGDIVFALA
ncbi:hypothetical protein [Agromyces binzhouensis]|uniref:hypothetical protein n=1 Tax=Agromyces binzhouensis TaxID=1817495 RepID=UPI0036412256